MRNFDDPTECFAHCLEAARIREERAALGYANAIRDYTHAARWWIEALDYCDPDAAIYVNEKIARCNHHADRVREWQKQNTEIRQLRGVTV